VSLKTRLEKLTTALPNPVKPVRLIYLKEGEFLADALEDDDEASKHDNIVLIGVRPTRSFS